MANLCKTDGGIHFDIKSVPRHNKHASQFWAETEIDAGHKPMMLDDNVIVMRIEEKLNPKRAITHAYSFLTFRAFLSS